ncbi:MAG: hypothetical protein J0L92_14155 [Deltaproteobacteria bacterium]|nr:hypothetical protein [Deltaproteobacteria bacterium]
MTALRSVSAISRLATLALASSLSITAACGGAVGATRTEATASRRTPRTVDEALAQFPTRERMNALVRQLPAEREVREIGPIVDRWEIEPASLAGEVGPFEGVAAALAGGGFESRGPLRCAAREIARFVGAQGELPNTFLGDYIVGRCGSASLRATIAVRAFDVRGYDEARLARETGTEVADGWRPLLGEHTGGLGVASIASRDRIYVAIVIDPDRTMRIALSAPAQPVEGRVRVEGELTGATEELLALSSRGEADVALCVTELVGTHLRVDCPFDSADETAFIEVITREPGRLVPRTGARIVVAASPEAGLVYEERALEAEAPADALDAIVAAVNAHRARLGREPLSLERTQSEANRESVDAFFATTSPDVQEVAVLYAMAGWEVQGNIVGGNALAFELPGGLAPNRWASYILRHPFERYALLDPDVSRIAVGVSASPSATLAMVSTYQLFGPADPEGERARVLAAVQRARAEAGRPPVGLLPQVPALARWAARVTGGAAAPTEAMQRAMSEGAVPGARATMVLGLHDLDEWPVPREVLEAHVLDVAVAHFRAEGAAWGQYAVLIVLG